MESIHSFQNKATVTVKPIVIPLLLTGLQTLNQHISSNTSHIKNILITNRYRPITLHVINFNFHLHALCVSYYDNIRLSRRCCTSSTTFCFYFLKAFVSGLCAAASSVILLHTPNFVCII